MQFTYKLHTPNIIHLRARAYNIETLSQVVHRRLHTSVAVHTGTIETIAAMISILDE